MNLSKINFEFDYNLSKKKYFAGSASIKENIITLHSTWLVIDLHMAQIPFKVLFGTNNEKKNVSKIIIKKKLYIVCNDQFVCTT